MRAQHDVDAAAGDLDLRLLLGTVGPARDESGSATQAPTTGSPLESRTVPPKRWASSRVASAPARCVRRVALRTSAPRSIRLPGSQESVTT